jgi:hypothetical protein
MKFFGNIELINGEIINLKVEEVSELDTNDTTKPNHLIAYDGNLYFNNGNGFRLIQLSDTSASPLLLTLGQEWINEDLTFNPNNFNDFSNVSDLTSENSLYDVLFQLDQAISNVTQNSIAQLNDVLISNLETGDILVSIDDMLTNIPLETAIKNYGNINIKDLQDYATTNTLINNDIVIWNSSNSKFTNKRSFYKTNNNSNTSSYVVSHNLNSLYCFVEVIDKLTNTKIPSSGYTVYYDNINTLAVNLESATVAEIIVFSL